MIKIEVQSTRAVIRSQEPLTVGLKGAKASFSFGKPWETLIKTAVFRQGEKTVTVADIVTEVTIPSEVLTLPGVPVEIGVYGIDSTGAVAIPTVWAKTHPVCPGADPEGDPSTEPTPGLWEQMQGKLGSLEQLETDEKSSLVAAINEANRAICLVKISVGDDGTYSSDTCMTDLERAYSDGKMLICYLSGFLMPLSSYSDIGIYKFTAIRNNTEYCVTIHQDGDVTYTNTVLATTQSKLPNPQKLTIIGNATAEYDGSEAISVKIPDKTSDLENDSGFLTSAPVKKVSVTKNEDGTYEAEGWDAAKILEAHNAGNTVCCQYGTRVLPMILASKAQCVFGCVHSGNVHTVTVGASVVTVDVTPLASGSGTDGITPHIGANGNWFIGETDTGMPSRGETGAQGPQGEKGEQGPQGEPGEKGEKGDTGAIGPQGPAGETGAQGPQGEKGNTGDTGAAGVSPTVTVFERDGKKYINIEDKDGIHTAVLEDGVTPHIGANGNWFIGETDTGMPSRGADGETGAQGLQGEKGETGAAGADGKTPVKGEDYFTEADKAEIISEAVAATGYDTYTNLFDKSKAVTGFFYSGGETTTSSKHANSGPVWLEPGGYLFKAFSYFGSNGRKAFIVNSDGTTTGKYINATALSDTVYAVTISTAGYYAFNVAKVDYGTGDLDGYMLVAGETLDDWPPVYVAYGTPLKVKKTNLEFSQNPLHRKKVVFDGDSICAGATAATGSGWASRIGEANEMTWYNVGVGGGTITSGTTTSSGENKHWVSTNLDTIYKDHPDLDYLILEGGTNDADLLGEEKLGTISNIDVMPEKFDPTADFTQAMEYLLSKAIYLYPNARIGFIVAHKMGTVNDYSASIRRKYFDRCVEVCQKYGIPCLDLWNTCHLHPRIDKASHGDAYYLYTDGQHLSDAGYDYIAPIIEQWMRTI